MSTPENSVNPIQEVPQPSVEAAAFGFTASSLLASPFAVELANPGSVHQLAQHSDIAGLVERYPVAGTVIFGGAAVVTGLTMVSRAIRSRVS